MVGRDSFFLPRFAPMPATKAAAALAGERHCSAAQAALALDRAVTKCGDSGSLPPGCDPALQWTSHSYARSIKPPGAQLLRQRQCARDELSTYLCGLPIRSEARALPKPPDWAFGSVPPTPGKFLARWVLHLYLALTDPSPSRYVLPSVELKAWPWLPAHGCDLANGSAAWLIADVCAAIESDASKRANSSKAHREILASGTRRGLAPLRDDELEAGFSELFLVARGNRSGLWQADENPEWVATQGGGRTTPGLWLAAQLMRHVRGAMGPCLRRQTHHWVKGARPPHDRSNSLADSLVREHRWREQRLREQRLRGVGSQHGRLLRRSPGRPRRVALHIRRGDACERYGTYIGAGVSGAPPPVLHFVHNWRSEAIAVALLLLVFCGLRRCTKAACCQSIIPRIMMAPEVRFGVVLFATLLTAGVLVPFVTDTQISQKRPCFGAADYLKAARELLAANASNVPPHELLHEPPQLLVASDSPAAISELRAAFAHPREFEITSAQGGRGAGWGGAAEGANMDKAREEARRQFIETRNGAGLVDRSQALASLFADLEVLSQSDAFVGTAASWTSRLIFLAIIGEAGGVPPFIFLDRPLGGFWFA